MFSLEPIDPKPTSYGGVMFRSRAEARWAVFFDALAWRWAYEPRRFRLPDGTSYLPDFHLADFDAWVEVKGGGSDAAGLMKAIGLHEMTRRPVWLLNGVPGEGGPLEDYYMDLWMGGERYPLGTTGLGPCGIRTCRGCGQPVFYFEGPHGDGGHGYWWFRLDGKPCTEARCGDKEPTVAGPVQMAADRAASYRFLPKTAW